MSYYAHISNHDLRISDTKRALKLMLAAGLQAAGDLEDTLIAYGYDDIEIAKDGTFTMLSFNNRYRNDSEIWQALAPVVVPTGEGVPFIEWMGEENEKNETWRYVFEDGEMTEVSCDIVWPYLNQQRRREATVDPLTLEGRAKQLLVDALERHIEHHIGLDGQSTSLVRECQMTLKSVRDADKVILNMEVVQ